MVNKKFGGNVTHLVGITKRYLPQTDTEEKLMKVLQNKRQKIVRKHDSEY